MIHTILLRTAIYAASTAPVSAEDGSTGTPWHIILSNIAGSASILCWFIVFSPQLWENYKRKSGESLSLTFLYIWLAGDIFNVLGATMDNLLLTMRILAWYYTLADIGLIAQVHYYRRTSAKASFEAVIAASAHRSKPSASSSTEHNHLSESTSLLAHIHNINNNKDIECSDDTIIEEAAKAANATALSTGGSIAHATLPTASLLEGYVPNSGYGATTPSVSASSSTGDNSNSDSKAGQVFRRASEAWSTGFSIPSRDRLRALLIVLPLMVSAFFLWTYFDWLQCLSSGGEWQYDDGQNTHGGAHCGRGHGRGRLPPLPGHEGHGPNDDSEDFVNSLLSNSSTPSPGPYDSLMPLIFGWGSAALYLGSRVPQIYKNWRLQSCEGLSMFMFLFSVMGNGFYVASIFLNSTERTYLIRNMPYWLGSSGTLCFDFTIFTQFYLYRHNQPLTEALKDATESGALTQDTVESLSAATEVSTTTQCQDSDQRV
ncbi:hypothetical protein BG004_000689 [Podila humilis]|nr:hypothetical protein BG004_000689 [Podila humilis]